MAGKNRKSHGRITVRLVMLFFFSAFILMGLRDWRDQTLLIAAGEDAVFRWQAFALALAVPAVIGVCDGLLARIFRLDRLLLLLMNFLCALGILVLYTASQDKALRQCLFYGTGLPCLLICSLLVRGNAQRRLLTPVLAVLSAVLLLLPLFMGIEKNSARSWLLLGQLSVQPSELAKVTVIPVLAALMARRRTLSWLGFLTVCVTLILLQGDLGTASIYYMIGFLLYWTASGSWAVSAAGLAGGAAGAAAGYRLFPYVRIRVAVWRNPWIDPENTGYQLAKGLIALASAGLFGTGLGLGYPTEIPVYETDFVFNVLVEQFGLIFGLCVILCYVLLVRRGAMIAMTARREVQGLTAMGCTILIGLQTFVILGGVLNLIPLTGVTMPFVSHGGSSMVSCMCLMGILQGTAAGNEEALRQDIRMAEQGGGAS